MKVGVIGSGGVAKALATGFLKHGHQAMMGTRTAGKLAEWAAANPKGSVGSFADAAAFGEIVVLAVKGKVAAGALQLAGAGNLAGKLVIDATNPIEDAPPLARIYSVAPSTRCSTWSRRAITPSASAAARPATRAARAACWRAPEAGTGDSRRRTTKAPTRSASPPPDRKFTMRTVACFGQCALAPVVEWNHRICGHVNDRTLQREVEALANGRK
jgi:hypothetical protein